MVGRVEGLGDVDIIDYKGIIPPVYVIALHRLARLGMASRYSASKRFVQFEIKHPMAAKFVGLQDADRVTIIYREVPNAGVC